MNCTVCGKQMDPSARFCSQCGAVMAYATMNPAHDRLVRPRYGRMIAGVCAGFAQRFGWEVTIVRLVLVLAVVLGAGCPVIAYLIAWIVMPNGQYFLPVQTSQPVSNQTGATI